MVFLVLLARLRQPVHKADFARIVVLAVNQQQITRRADGQGDDAFLLLRHGLCRLNRVVKDVAEQGVNVAVLHEADAPPVRQTRHRDAQIRARQHLAAQRHIQRGILRVRRRIVDVDQLTDFFQFFLIACIAQRGNLVANIVAFEVDGVVNLPLLLIAPLLAVQHLRRDIRLAFVFRFPQMAHADDNGQQGEHGAHDVVAVAQLAVARRGHAVQRQVQHDRNRHHAHAHKQHHAAAHVREVHNRPLTPLSHQNSIVAIQCYRHQRQQTASIQQHWEIRQRIAWNMDDSFAHILNRIRHCDRIQRLTEICPAAKGNGQHEQHKRCYIANYAHSCALHVQPHILAGAIHPAECQQKRQRDAQVEVLALLQARCRNCAARTDGEDKRQIVTHGVYEVFPCQHMILPPYSAMPARCSADRNSLRLPRLMGKVRPATLVSLLPTCVTKRRLTIV